MLLGPAGGQFLCSFTLSCVRRGNSQSTWPRSGDKIRVGVLAAKPEAGGRVERAYQLRRAADLCPAFPESRRWSSLSPVTINLLMLAAAAFHSRSPPGRASAADSSAHMSLLKDIEINKMQQNPKQLHYSGRGRNALSLCSGARGLGRRINPFARRCGIYSRSAACRPLRRDGCRGEGERSLLSGSPGPARGSWRRTQLAHGAQTPCGRTRRTWASGRLLFRKLFILR